MHAFNQVCMQAREFQVAVTSGLHWALKPVSSAALRVVVGGRGRGQRARGGSLEGQHHGETAYLMRLSTAADARWAMKRSWS